MHLRASTHAVCVKRGESNKHAPNRNRRREEKNNQLNRINHIASHRRREKTWILLVDIHVSRIRICIRYPPCVGFVRLLQSQCTIGLHAFSQMDKRECVGRTGNRVAQHLDKFSFLDLSGIAIYYIMLAVFVQSRTQLCVKCQMCGAKWN